MSAGKSLLVSAKEAIRLFAYKAGMKLIAAGADVEIKSLSQNIHMLAKLDITHTANRIEITAKEEVLMNGGGSYRRWSAGGIEEGTSGNWAAHAASHDLNGPKSLPVQSLPDLSPYNEMLVLRDKKGRPVANFPYKLTLGDGRVVSGITDSQGRTQRAGSGNAPTAVRMEHPAQR